MDTLKGAAKSKLIWLGLGQVVWGLVQLWAHDGLTWDSAMPVIGGGATIVFRAMTDESLASKGAAAPAE